METGIKVFRCTFVIWQFFKFNLQIVHQKYFLALNGLFSKIGTDSPLTALSLIGSYCIPLLLYCIESMNIRQSDYNSLDAAYNAAFAKIFSTDDKNVIKQCQYFCCKVPFPITMDMKRLKFYDKLSLVSNKSLLGLFMTFGRHKFTRLLSNHNLSVKGSHSS